MAEVIKAFKGFNRDMTCRDFQYEEGKEYETDKAEACECGFHASEYPLDVFSYYPPGTSVYHEVEQSGKLDKSESDKVASTRIKIGARIDIIGLVKAAIEYVKERCTNENNADRNDHSRQCHQMPKFLLHNISGFKLFLISDTRKGIEPFNRS